MWRRDALLMVAGVVAAALVVPVGDAVAATKSFSYSTIGLTFPADDCRQPIGDGNVVVNDIGPGTRLTGTARMEGPGSNDYFFRLYYIPTTAHGGSLSEIGTVDEVANVTYQRSSQSYPDQAFDFTAPYSGELVACRSSAVDGPNGFVTGTIPDAEADRDKDGVPDGADLCPDQAGPADRQGCPDLKPVVSVATTTTIDGGQPRTAFDASASRDPDGGALSYRWHFGDGSPDSTTGPVIAHLYPRTGRFTPSLEITDDEGNKALWIGAEIVAIDRYEITLRAWIPQKEVVDPENLVDRTAVTVQRYCEPPRPIPSYMTSRFDGNDHAGYDGGGDNPVKGQVTITLEWDGKNLKQVGEVTKRVGPTRRNVTYTNLQGFSKQCVEEGQAGITTTSAVSGDTFSIGFATSNPLTPPRVTPAINSRLSGRFQGNQLVVTTQTDTFPSHGFEIRRNSDVLTQQIVLNAACLTVLGPAGAARIGAGLFRYDGRQGGLSVQRSVDLRGGRADYTAPCLRG